MLHKKRKPSTFTNSSNANVNAVNHLLHSKSTYFYRWDHLIPSVCGVALLCGVWLLLNPTMNSSNGFAYAETITSNPTDYSSISMAISSNNKVSSDSGTELDNEDTISTNVTPGLVNYIDNNIKISTSRIDRFYVTVQAAENGTSELTGTAHGETIAPVGKDITVDNFGDNTWGYALGDTTTSNSSFTYNSLPTYNTAITPQYTSAQNLQDGDYNLKLTFAAKINADKPSDHYTTKAMVSVAADAKEITTMQEFAEVGLCSSMKENEQRQLVDDRSASGLGQTKYWIAKLKDGKCWMTQNLDLALATSDKLKPTDTGVITEYVVPDLSGLNYRDPGMMNYKITAASAAYPSSCGDPTASGCAAYFETYTGTVSGDEEAHYLIGNYYPWTIAMAGQTEEDKGSICPKGWKLPTSSEYSTLINSVANTNATTNTIRTSPYYFIPAGGVSGSIYSQGAYQGDYWSSTSSSSPFANTLRLNSGGLSSSNNGKASGFSVRCVLK